MKLVQVCLSSRKVRESRFHLCGGLQKLVYACLSARKDREAVFATWRSSGARVDLLKCQERSRKPFSQLWGSC